ncbi:MAG TPA: lectin [Hyphomicrobium sp.]|nr:lectin [Hyphomicrobium sp.]
MTNMNWHAGRAFAAALACVLPASAARAEPASMTFFVTSAGPGDGANLGGLAGADAHCKKLADTAGAGQHIWRAYLSASAAGGGAAVNARDRIGNGPWTNANGVVIAASVEDLHSANNKLSKETAVDENGNVISGRGDKPNRHDILTGSQADGAAFAGDEDKTCGNWTKNAEGSAIVGHHDRMGLNDSAPMKSWNSSHGSKGCSQDNLRSTGGDGLFYCFATD